MLIHECAHILAALTLGLRVKKVGLKVSRGLYTVREAGPLHKNLLVALAGPVMNVLLIPAWHLSPGFGLANLCYAVANLLPIEGSDGSRALACMQALHRKPVDRASAQA
jgi:Zn-dependent protease